MYKYLALALCLLVACGDKESDSADSGEQDQEDTAAE